jgi:hypothetical protein
MPRLLIVAFTLLAISSPLPQQTRPDLVSEAKSIGKWLRSGGHSRRRGARVGGHAGGAQGAAGRDALLGTPGVVLFFLELHNATGDAADLATARAGADWLITRIDAESSAGLYTGLAGIGFTLTEVWKVTKIRSTATPPIASSIGSRRWRSRLATASSGRR